MALSLGSVHELLCRGAHIDLSDRCFVASFLHLGEDYSFDVARKAAVKGVILRERRDALKNDIDELDVEG